jgi:hypothetical protein
MTCPIDGRPTPNNMVICPTCEETLDRNLGELDALLEDLDVALTRQARKRPTSGTGERDDRPLPFELGASKAAGELKAVLVGWARLVSEEREVDLTCRDTSQSIASWLMHHTHWLACHPAAADAWCEIITAVNTIRRVIDSPETKRFIGPCGYVFEGVECTDTLWAVDGSETARCRTCGTIWDARERMLDALANATRVAQDATTLSRSFTLRGIAIDSLRIRNWARPTRGLLTAHGISERGKPAYIVAHVARLIQLHEAGQKLSPWPEEQEQSA